jgi:hypothetical protein
MATRGVYPDARPVSVEMGWLVMPLDVLQDLIFAREYDTQLRRSFSASSIFKPAKQKPLTEDPGRGVYFVRSLTMTYFGSDITSMKSI